jgi:hypothetical protein
MTCIGPRFLLFGGFDGKNTFGDLWWLVPEGIEVSYLGAFICIVQTANCQSF